jgi:hypothetical protein
VVSPRRITGPTFYSDTVNAARYMNNMLCPLFTKLTEEDRLYGVFKKDSVTSHTMPKSSEVLWEVFSDGKLAMVCGPIFP